MPPVDTKRKSAPSKPTEALRGLPSSRRRGWLRPPRAANAARVARAVLSLDGGGLPTPILYYKSQSSRKKDPAPALDASANAHVCSL